MIEAHYNPITGQSFTVVDVPIQQSPDMDTKAAVEKIQKQKTANLRKNNCKNK